MANLKLDAIDKQIIKIMQENCKITNLELSKRVGLSPAPTLERVKKLESNGILASYHAHVDRNAIGLSVQTYLLAEIAWHIDDALDNFLEKIDKIDEVVECYIITGEADALMKIICKDIPSYEHLLFKTLSKIEEIERLKTLMTLSQVKNTHVLPYDYDDPS
ncbi:MAG TPA: Lrp/AsnC family transcriptional regulator [Membranihabitans sp.]|nr:Lrp/AsnC family transcriptional regulator [Membranihabitans sp.]